MLYASMSSCGGSCRRKVAHALRGGSLIGGWGCPGGRLVCERVNLDALVEAIGLLVVLCGCWRDMLRRRKLDCPPIWVSWQPTHMPLGTSLASTHAARVFGGGALALSWILRSLRCVIQAQFGPLAPASPDP